MPVKSAGGGKFRIPNVPGTGTKKEKEKQLRAIKANQKKKRPKYKVD